MRADVRSDLEIAEFACRHEGLVNRGTASSLGLTGRQIEHRVRLGRWSAVADGVYRVAPPADPWRSSLWSMVLGTATDVAVSHEAAAALHRIPTFRPGPVVVSVEHGHTRLRRDARTRQSTDLRAEHLGVVDGLPTTTLARTIVDLAPHVTFGRLQYSAGGLFASGELQLEDLIAVFEDVNRRGKPGITALRRLIADETGTPRQGTRLEQLFLALCRQRGIPAPVLQFSHPHDPLGNLRVDAAYPDRRVLIELDSRQWHTRIDDFERDRRRDRNATILGWTTVRFTWRDVTRQPDVVVADLRALLDTKRTQAS